MELRLARTFDALAEIHTAIDDFCAQHAVAERDVFVVQLAVEELFTNLVKHDPGGGQTIELGLERVDDRLAISLVDHDATFFDPEHAPEVDVGAPLEARRPGGLGLHLVRTYLDELDYEYTDRTLRITAVKILEARNV